MFLSDGFYIPIVFKDQSMFINQIDLKKPTRLEKLAEIYLSSGLSYYEAGKRDIRGRFSLRLANISLTNPVSKAKFYMVVVLKIAILICSIGLFPLLMFKIKQNYRDRNQHSFYLPDFFERMPEELIAKIVLMAGPLTRTNCYVNRRFAVISRKECEIAFHVLTKIDCKGLNLETEESIKKYQSEVVKWIKKYYTRGKEPSPAQRVRALCQVLWKDIHLFHASRDIVLSKKMEMDDLMQKEQYNSFQAFIQPTKIAGLIHLANMLSNQHPPFHSLERLLSSNEFRIGNDGKQASLIREWLQSVQSANELKGFPDNETHIKAILILKKFSNYLWLDSQSIVEGMKTNNM